MNFTFKTKADYDMARRRNYIDSFDIGVLVKKMSNGDEWHIPAYSEEEFYEMLDKANNNPEVIETSSYQDTSYYDIEEYL